MVRFPYSHMSIGSFAAALGVSVVTIRRWCRSGKIKEAFRTPGGHRRFSQTLLRKLMGVGATRVKMGYARVSSHDQKPDLATQAARLAKHANHVIEDLGSGLNC